MPWFPQQVLWQTEDFVSRPKISKNYKSICIRRMQALLQLQFSNEDTHTHVRDCEGIKLVEIELKRTWMRVHSGTNHTQTLRTPYGPPIFCFKDGATLLPILTSLDSWGLLPKNLDKHRGLEETFSGQSNKSDQDHPKVCVRVHALDTDMKLRTSHSTRPDFKS